MLLDRVWVLFIKAVFSKALICGKRSVFGEKTVLKKHGTALNEEELWSCQQACYCSWHDCLLWFFTEKHIFWNFRWHLPKMPKGIMDEMPRTNYLRHGGKFIAILFWMSNSNYLRTFLKHWHIWKKEGGNPNAACQWNLLMLAFSGVDINSGIMLVNNLAWKTKAARARPRFTKNESPKISSSLNIYLLNKDSCFLKASSTHQLLLIPAELVAKEITENGAIIIKLVLLKVICACGQKEAKNSVCGFWPNWACSLI